jgi:hypothetical protein
LYDDAIDLISIKIDHVLRLPLRFLGARLFHLKEPEVGKNGERNGTQN